MLSNQMFDFAVHRHRSRLVNGFVDIFWQQFAACG